MPCFFPLELVCRRHRLSFSDLTLPTSTFRPSASLPSVYVFLRGYGYPPVHLSAYFFLGVILLSLHTCLASAGLHFLYTSITTFLIEEHLNLHISNSSGMLNFHLQTSLSRLSLRVDQPPIYLHDS